MVAVAVVAVVGVVAFVLLSLGTRKPDGFDYVVIVPEGTAARVANGEAVELMPHNVKLRVYDRLVIDNRDTAVHTIGPFVVRPGERFAYGFDEPGRYVGGCTVDPSGTITISVT
jgi:hypothetical protein